MNQEGLNPASRLDRLLPLLEADPSNLALLADAAATALEERRPETAAELLDRYRSRAPLPPKERNLAGLAALQMHDFEAAARHFAVLAEQGERDPGLLFNLAWSRAMLKEFDGALMLLDESVTVALPQAAMLQIQLLHESGNVDLAMEHARAALERHPEYPPLLAAVSVLAIDAEDVVLAEACARGAGAHPDALATLGTLTLGEERPAEAMTLFEQALAQNRQVPRAWVGLGLAKLLSGRGDEAADDIDRGAEMFGDHIGSWIASGWAYFVRQDLVTSRERFERALAIDETFAESHGSLAVLDVLDGRLDDARRRSDTALRLDRQCYSAALARTLLLAGGGNPEAAQRIFENALRQPLNDKGDTIGQALAKLGLGR
ncbi:tetratricopeptide repeat protein [Allosphingosinicella deserti]|nr:tetratricopeptide repeat protein [Sphingomonas deserti]